MTSGIRARLGMSSSVTSVKLLWVESVVKRAKCSAIVVQEGVEMSNIAQLWPLCVVYKAHVPLSLTPEF